MEPGVNLFPRLPTSSQLFVGTGDQPQIVHRRISRIDCTGRCTVILVISIKVGNHQLPQ